MPDVNDWNASVIAEFRANAGKVGGRFANAPMVLITTRGARTGKLRTNPLVCLPEGNRLVIFASKGGAPSHPDWYYNLRANPDVTVEYGAERYAARAVILEGSERDRLFAEQARRMPAFADYQAKTTRTIPVIALDRVPQH
jgi:deazaflavin-dependent oxidoreductase (nitroreductase family)